MTSGPVVDPSLESGADPDWSRVAIPQKNAYDTDVLLQALRDLDDSHEIQHPANPGPDEPTLFGGRVAVREGPRPAMREPDFRLAPLDDPALTLASSLLTRWSEIHEQFGRVMRVLVPLHSASVSPAQRAFMLGSSSYSDDRVFGLMLATVEDPLGLAQAMVQEMARCKLRALGIFSHEAHRFLTNPPEERATSPIRHDGPRPVPEVVHAVYSFVHVIALDLAMIEGEEDPRILERMVLLLARNTPRMRSGCGELERTLRTDRPGEVFFGAFLAWADEILARADQTLDRHGFGFPALAG